MSPLLYGNLHGVLSRQAPNRMGATVRMPVISTCPSQPTDMCTCSVGGCDTDNRRGLPFLHQKISKTIPFCYINLGAANPVWWGLWTGLCHLSSTRVERPAPRCRSEVQMSSSPGSSPSKRREMDVMKLCARGPSGSASPRATINMVRPLFCRMMSDYDVSLVDDNPANFYIIFHGPKDSACLPHP